MPAQQDESLIRELARPLVSTTAPAEKDLFEILSDAHFARPGAYADADPGTGPLAFGLPESTVLLTPIILAAMTEAVKYVVGRLMATGTKVTAREIRRLFAAARRTPPADPEEVSAPAEVSVSLTPQEWAEVHRIVEEVARRGGLAADQARLVADAAVAQGILDEAAGDR